jgi:hypothetical protein
MIYEDCRSVAQSEAATRRWFTPPALSITVWSKAERDKTALNFRFKMEILLDVTELHRFTRMTWNKNRNLWMDDECFTSFLNCRRNLQEMLTEVPLAVLYI